MYEAIRSICEKNKISVSELERRAGLGNGTIRLWKHSSPNLESLEKVADALGMKVTTLINKSNIS